MFNEKLSKVLEEMTTPIEDYQEVELDTEVLNAKENRFIEVDKVVTYGNYVEYMPVSRDPEEIGPTKYGIEEVYAAADGKLYDDYENVIGEIENGQNITDMLEKNEIEDMEKKIEEQDRDIY